MGWKMPSDSGGSGVGLMIGGAALSLLGVGEVVFCGRESRPGSFSLVVLCRLVSDAVMSAYCLLGRV